MSWNDMPFPTTPQVWLAVIGHLLRADQVVRFSAKPMENTEALLMVQVHADAADADGPREYLVSQMASVDDAEMLALEALQVISGAFVAQKSGVVVYTDDGKYELLSFSALRKIGKIER